jgi:hypothetical protein
MKTSSWRLEPLSSQTHQQQNDHLTPYSRQTHTASYSKKDAITASFSFFC